MHCRWTSFVTLPCAWSNQKQRCCLTSDKWKSKYTCCCISSGWRTLRGSIPSSPVIQIGKKSSSGTETTSVESSPKEGGVKVGLKSDSLGTLPFWVFAAVFIVGIRLYTKKYKEKKQEAAKSDYEEKLKDELQQVPETTTILEQEQENSALHVFKCANCGYSLFPAKGREFKFFTVSFKCPACGSSKEAFYDTSDPSDPRNNQEEDEEEIKESS